jgi:hypothetical protein
MLLDDIDGTADGGGVGQRGAAELVHVRCAAVSWHRIVRIIGVLAISY